VPMYSYSFYEWKTKSIQVHHKAPLLVTLTNCVNIVHRGWLERSVKVKAGASFLNNDKFIPQNAIVLQR
jgi:hypothetical protein